MAAWKQGTRMADELKDQRVVTMMSSSEIEAIDDWAFANRIRSRGEAIRRLCQMAIGFEAQRIAEGRSPRDNLENATKEKP